MLESLLHRFRAHRAVVGVIGMGYVGLPLVLRFAEAGFKVIGFDSEEEKVRALNTGKSYIRHCPSESIGRVLASGRFAATTTLERVPECDALLICLPTPLSPQREPDLSYVVRMAEALVEHLRAGQLVVLESTTYPGATNDVLRPVLARSGLVMGRELFLAFCPEREDPGSEAFTAYEIPRVVGGVDEASGDLAEALYQQIVSRTVRVRDARTAEAVKLTENIFRAVNIALVNELKLIYSRLGIDIWEVIEAARTKPFGYMPFYPGPGIGGHCIPIDPFYLTWKAREVDLSTRFIELAGEINRAMPGQIVQVVQETLNERGRPLKDARIVILGLAYKPDVDDLRESPALVILEELLRRGARVDYHDPFIAEIPPTRRHKALTALRSLAWEEVLGGNHDLAVIATGHGKVDYAALCRALPLVIDTVNICRSIAPDNVIYA